MKLIKYWVKNKTKAKSNQLNFHTLRNYHQKWRANRLSIFVDKQKLKEFVASRLGFQEMLQEVLHREGKWHPKLGSSWKNEKCLRRCRKKVKSLSCIWLFATPWTVACWAPPSMGYSRQEYWSGLPFPSSEYHPVICNKVLPPLLSRWNLRSIITPHTSSSIAPSCSSDLHIKKHNRISQYIQKSSHYVVYLELMQCSIIKDISRKWKEK